MSDENKLELISFLKELTLSLEKDNLHTKQLENLQKFHKIYKFTTEAIKSDTDTVTDDVVFADEAKDFFKFIMLAWFMYCLMKKKL